MVSWPAAKRLAATRATSMASGIVPSGNVAVAMPVITSSRGVAPAVLDVRGELLVEELERVVRERLGAGAPDAPSPRVAALEPARNVSWSLSGHAEQVGDRRSRANGARNR